jgi:hypothetical protein
MKITQEKPEEKFHPITIVLETKEELINLLVAVGSTNGYANAEKALKDYNVSDAVKNEADYHRANTTIYNYLLVLSGLKRK